jgi:hypothetical protein
MGIQRRSSLVDEIGLHRLRRPVRADAHGGGQTRGEKGPAGKATE